MESLDALRFVIGAGFLGYAVQHDLRTRRVPNGVWVALSAAALALGLVDVVETGRFDWWTLVVAAAVIAVAYALWWIHIIPGGADAKAIMALGLLVPEPIQWDLGGAAGPAWSSPMPGALVAVANAALLVAVVPLVYLVLNVARGHVAFPAMLLGYRMRLERAAESYVWIVDRVAEDGTASQALFPSRMSDEAYEANIERLAAKGLRSVWVTPKVPFMIPLAAGFGLAFVAGDVLFRAVELLLRGALGP